MDKPLLNEQAIFPSNEVLNDVLVDSHPAFAELLFNIPFVPHKVFEKYPDVFERIAKEFLQK